MSCQKTLRASSNARFIESRYKPVKATETNVFSIGNQIGDFGCGTDGFGRNDTHGKIFKSDFHGTYFRTVGNAFLKSFSKICI